MTAAGGASERPQPPTASRLKRTTTIVPWVDRDSQLPRSVRIGWSLQLRRNLEVMRVVYVRYGIFSTCPDRSIMNRAPGQRYRMANCGCHGRQKICSLVLDNLDVAENHVDSERAGGSPEKSLATREF